MRRKYLKIFLISLSVIVLILLTYLFIPVSKDILYEKVGFSYKIYSKKGFLLRRGLSTKGFYFSYIKIDEIPDMLTKSLLVAEDKDFHSHFGISFTSLFRAVYENIFTSKPVSGASTITMQVARNIYNFKRNIFSKLFEMYYALKLEISFTKKEILELYLNTIPFGNKIIGIKMAARYYFNKRVSDLSDSESVFLAAAVKYPNYINNEKINRIIKRKNYILKKLLKQKTITTENYKKIKYDKTVIHKFKKFIYAPHFTDYLIKKIKTEYADKLNKISEIHTTIDLDIQKKVFNKTAAVLNRLLHKQISNASVIVLDNNTGELVAMLGSLNYFSNNKDGQVNGALALRSPGSTLKPFTYATGFENKVITPGSIIPDIKTFISSTRGDYMPSNDDRRYHGPVTVRKALACSYNIPAARVIQRVGVEQVLNKMRLCGFTSLTKTARHYGAALVLGGADVSLFELTRAYMTFANNGYYNKIKIIKKVINIYGKDITKDKPNQKQKIFSKHTAFLIKSILSDNKAREDNFTLLSALNFPFFVASKTGTSKGFRNNWTVGFSKNYTVGVWVGNFNNRPMQGVSGITGAGSIYRNIFLEIEKDYDYKLTPTDKIISRKICIHSGLLAKKNCSGQRIEYFLKGSEPKTHCNIHFLVPFKKSTGKIVMKIKDTGYKHNRNIRWKNFTILPEIYNEWLSQKGYKPPSLKVLKYIKQKDGQRTSIKIIFPDNNDVFAIDPIIKRNFQKITFRAKVPLSTQKVVWKIGSRQIISKKYPFNYNWKLKRGIHDLKLYVYLKNGVKTDSRKIKFTVY